jgi:hypothetical protein
VLHGVRETQSQITSKLPAGHTLDQSIRHLIRERLVRSRLAAVRPSVRDGTQARRKPQGPQSDANPRLPHHMHKRQLHPASTADSLSPPRVHVQRHPGSSPPPGIRPRRAALAVQIHLQWGAKADAVLHLDRAVLPVDEWGSWAAYGRARKRKAGGVVGDAHSMRFARLWRRADGEGRTIYDRVILLSSYAPIEREGLSGG